MAAMGGSDGPKAANSGSASGFVWVSSSPSPAEVAALEGRFPEVIQISSETLEESSFCWKEQAILARTFQRWVPPEAFLREFRRAGVSGAIHPLSLGHRCHIFRFEDPGAKELVIGRPWVINGQPVAVEAWRPEFVPSADAVASALLWVRLPSLPVEFWKEEVLREILKPAGEFLCADPATRQISRGGFARVCVRVDLRRPIRPGVRIQGVGSPFWQPFQFEHLDGICTSCGSLHLLGPCAMSSPAPAAESSSAGQCFGPWLSVLRRRRPLEVTRSKSVKPFDSSQGSPAPSPASSLRVEPSSAGWLVPGKASRRRSQKAGKSIASGAVLSPLRMELLGEINSEACIF